MRSANELAFKRVDRSVAPQSSPPTDFAEEPNNHFDYYSHIWVITLKYVHFFDYLGRIMTNVVIDEARELLAEQHTLLKRQALPTIYDQLKRNNPLLQRVQLEKLEADECAKLIDALKGNTHLETLILTCCYQTLKTKGWAFGKVINAIPSLKKLNLDSALLGYAYGSNDLESFVVHLEHNTTITSLNLGNNDIHPRNIEAITALIRNNKTITHLNLKSNKLETYGIQVIANALKKNTTITSISFSNILRYEGKAAGARALANTLKSNHTIKKICLDHDTIGDEGAIAFASRLMDNCHLTFLSLAANQIGSVGFRALADSLLYNKNLAELYLVCNNLNLEDAIYFASRLKRNDTLIKSDLKSEWSFIVKSHEKPKFGEVLTEIKGYLKRNEILRIQAATGEKNGSPLAFMLKQYLKNKLAKNCLDEIVAVLFTLTPEQEADKQSIYRLVLWVLRDHLQDDAFKTMVGISIQKLSGSIKKKFPPCLLSSTVYIHYQQIIDAFTAVKSGLNKVLISQIEEKTINPNFSAEKADMLLAIPEIRRHLNLDKETEVLVIESLCLSKSLTMHDAIRQDLQHLANMKIKPPVSLSKSAVTFFQAKEESEFLPGLGLKIVL